MNFIQQRPFKSQNDEEQPFAEVIDCINEIPVIAHIFWLPVNKETLRWKCAV